MTVGFLQGGCLCHVRLVDFKNVKAPIADWKVNYMERVWGKKWLNTSPTLRRINAICKWWRQAGTTRGWLQHFKWPLEVPFHLHWLQKLLASFICMLQSSTCCKAEWSWGFLFSPDMHMGDWTEKCQFLPSLGEKIELHRDVNPWGLSANTAGKKGETSGKH